MLSWCAAWPNPRIASAFSSKGAAVTRTRFSLPFRKLSFYDSKPIVLGAEKNDYGVNTSLGWDF